MDLVTYLALSIKAILIPSLYPNLLSLSIHPLPTNRSSSTTIPTMESFLELIIRAYQ